ncbi:conserved hypothetical protein [Gammaproteobacteria bacterium]
MRRVENYWSFVLSAVGSVLLVGCVAPGPSPEEAHIAVQPDKAPVRNVTSFTPALQCMDNLFIKHGRTHPVTVTSVGITDATGKVMAGVGGSTRDMLISALAKMSTRSRAIKFLDLDKSQDEVRIGRAEMAGMEDYPDYNIRGAISGMDQGAVASSTSGGLNYTSPTSTPLSILQAAPPPQYSASIGAGQAGTSAVLSVDMNIVLIKTREVLPAYNSTNQIVISRAQKSVDAGGSFLGFGVNFNMNVDRAQGAHQAVRTLVELGAIETMGKLLTVPYWQCLDIEASNPGALSQAHDWYDTLDEGERTRQIQTALNQAGLFSGEFDGRMSDALRNAIGKYQATNGLIASGRIDFDLYNHLLNANLLKGSGSSERRTGEMVAAAAPITMSLSGTKGPSDTPYRQGESISLSLNLNRPAYVYCYYQDADKKVSRIFPNRVQSNAYVSGNTLQVPGERAPFNITMDKAGVTERIGCFAAPTEIGMAMPETFKVADLIPLQGVDSINELMRQIKGIRGATDMVMEVLNIPVK